MLQDAYIPGVHIHCWGTANSRGPCPTIAVDAIPGIFHEHVTLVHSGLLSENQKKKFLNFHNQNDPCTIREAVTMRG